MECKTISGYDEIGRIILKDKIKYNTLDQAIEVAKDVNIKKSRDKKVVAYKCTICFKYHIGRNGKVISDKEREKIIKRRTHS